MAKDSETPTYGTGADIKTCEIFPTARFPSVMHYEDIRKIVDILNSDPSVVAHARQRIDSDLPWLIDISTQG